MINVFQNNNINDRKIAEYINGTERSKFYYSKISREDYNKAVLFQNVDTSEATITIKTFSKIEFRIKDKVIIKGIYYTIISIYTEEQEQSDGIFRDNVIPIKYITLKTLNTPTRI